MTDQKKLNFFKVMAFIVGVALLVLTLHMVLRYGFDIHILDWWAQPHGFLYMVYLAAVVILGFDLRWGLGKMVGVMLAGVVPFLSFVVERRVSAQAQAQISARHADAGSMPG
ncbi:DUF3817 domain-containing protein [Ornithinimicrobium sp. Arc0846-15]|uniref:DUF3817 domain-containing protein n=1 Tax=Ornithinimicrobium sp. INDO-MA30-4 TaxID=2908651 RepID=UPI001C682CC1|nr:DUF3817 domain-containing protein [Ornithinimicrobium sp. INDO-MA30-4]MBW8173769.1 DUF3817 domain-containing protein [Ornithinimicrobium laminariae]UJH71495.1 DUF3817 domain-containing protein [Ornithinimicrobium sp. INDO-MA30-4]